ncbi:hypothetical protein [Chryseobacterium potabilaquae]|uniref:DUF4296 domain-containing protein n=1 Tax=Chryseobacterium potabilaquae TaxID=2675057 RepID=A0A6N4XBZ7_9FLAO|nr:hypothetical protein [Chryseobacterium potabilaquae]CAA7196987.1 hypothetical protein CHRY9293_03045 [Chryseobacterium potabilaquae]
MKNTFIISSIIFLFVVISCRKEIRSEKGGIDIISNVYFNASKNLEKMQNFHVSRINYSGNSIVELVPDHILPGVTSSINFIQDSMYYNLGNENSNKMIISELKKLQKSQSVYEKK